MAADPVQQHAYGSFYKPGPEDQSAKFSVRHPGCPDAIPAATKQGLKGQAEFGLAFRLFRE